MWYVYQSAADHLSCFLPAFSPVPLLCVAASRLPPSIVGFLRCHPLFVSVITIRVEFFLWCVLFFFPLSSSPKPAESLAAAHSGCAESRRSMSCRPCAGAPGARCPIRRAGVFPVDWTNKKGFKKGTSKIMFFFFFHLRLCCADCFALRHNLTCARAERPQDCLVCACEAQSWHPGSRSGRCGSPSPPAVSGVGESEWVSEVFIKCTH